MPEDFRNKSNDSRDIGRATGEANRLKNYEGFEGMNYEQFRKPYQPKYTDRKSCKDGLEESARPDES